MLASKFMILSLDSLLGYIYEANKSSANCMHKMKKKAETHRRMDEYIKKSFILNYLHSEPSE